MTDIVSAITNAVQIIKKLKEVNENIRNAEIKNCIGDLMNELGDLKMAVGGLKEENSVLRQQVADLSKPEAAKMEVRDGVYFMGDDGPFCTGCYDSTGKKIRVSEMGSVFHDIGKYTCPICKATYGGRLRP